MFEDPIVRVMAFGAAGIGVLYLAAITGALVFGVIGSPTPRTAAERQLDVAQTAIQAGDKGPKGYAALVNALTDVGQYAQAQNTIDSAPKTAQGSPSGDLELAQATLYYARKDYTRAIKACDVTMKTIDTPYQADLKKSGLNYSKSYGIDPNYYAALLLKGICQQAVGDNQAALKSFDDYLAKNPMETHALVDRGQVKLQLKDKAGAKADFDSALKYDPSNQRAIDELKKIGAK
jgi:tetratricopeptide (TPR) repeat protein